MTGDTPSQKHGFIMTPSIHFIKLVSSCSVSVVGDRFRTLSILSPFTASLLGSLGLQITKSIPLIAVSMTVSTSALGTEQTCSLGEVRCEQGADFCLCMKREGDSRSSESRGNKSRAWRGTNS